MAPSNAPIHPGLVVAITGFTLTAFSTLIVALRFYCRYFLMGSVAIHDYMMGVALVVTWGNSVINYYQYIYGDGARLSVIRAGHREQFAKALQGTLITWYTYRVTYVVGLCFAKLSILFFYRAIASHAPFRRAVYATMSFVGLYTLGMVFASLFQCQNPSDAWSIPAYLSQPGINKPEDHRKRRCYSPTALWTFSAAVNLFTDVVILIIPIPTLLALRVPLNKRLALIAIFSIGIMAIVASCVRVWILALWAESLANQNHFGPDLLLWGQVETNAGIVSSSIPFLRLLFKRSFGGSKPTQQEFPRNPKMAGTSNKPLELSSLQVFSGPDKGPNGSPRWEPFITVPESLSSRDSTSRYAPTRSA